MHLILVHTTTELFKGPGVTSLNASTRQAVLCILQAGFNLLLEDRHEGVQAPLLLSRLRRFRDSSAQAMPRSCRRQTYNSRAVGASLLPTLTIRTRLDSPVQSRCILIQLPEGMDCLHTLLAEGHLQTMDLLGYASVGSGMWPWMQSMAGPSPSTQRRRTSGMLAEAGKSIGRRSICD